MIDLSLNRIAKIKEIAERNRAKKELGKPNQISNNLSQIDSRNADTLIHDLEPLELLSDLYLGYRKIHYDMAINESKLGFELFCSRLFKEIEEELDNSKKNKYKYVLGEDYIKLYIFLLRFVSPYYRFSSLALYTKISNYMPDKLSFQICQIEKLERTLSEFSDIALTHFLVGEYNDCSNSLLLINQRFFKNNMIEETIYFLRGLFEVCQQLINKEGQMSEFDNLGYVDEVWRIEYKRKVESKLEYIYHYDAILDQLKLRENKSQHFVEFIQLLQRILGFFKIDNDVNYFIGHIVDSLKEIDPPTTFYSLLPPLLLLIYQPGAGENFNEVHIELKRICENWFDDPNTYLYSVLVAQKYEEALNLPLWVGIVSLSILRLFMLEDKSKIGDILDKFIMDAVHLSKLKESDKIKSFVSVGQNIDKMQDLMQEFENNNIKTKMGLIEHCLSNNFSDRSINIEKKFEEIALMMSNKEMKRLASVDLLIDFCKLFMKYNPSSVTQFALLTKAIYDYEVCYTEVKRKHIPPLLKAHLTQSILLAHISQKNIKVLAENKFHNFFNTELILKVYDDVYVEDSDRDQLSLYSHKMLKVLLYLNKIDDLLSKISNCEQISDVINDVFKALNHLIEPIICEDTLLTTSILPHFMVPQLILTLVIYPQFRLNEDQLSTLSLNLEVYRNELYFYSSLQEFEVRMSLNLNIMDFYKIFSFSNYIESLNNSFSILESKSLHFKKV